MSVMNNEQAHPGGASQVAIRVRDLKKTYNVGEGSLDVLGGVSFEINKGELVSVVGASGSGKSTLLHILGTLDTPSSGLVEIAGRDPFKGSDRQVSQFRNQEIGFVFQHNNLLAEFSALENVMMPALIGGANEAKVKKTALSLLEEVGLSHRISHYPGQMSGGEQQRVAIARALINNPTLLLADEPSGNLDTKNADNIHELFRNVNAHLGTTILVVTHNTDFAHSMQRTIEFRDGCVVSDNSRA